LLEASSSFSQNNDDDDDDDDDKPFSFSLQSSSNIQQLGGQGNRAVVREGCVLLPPAHEFHHYYKSSALFVYDIGYDDDQEEILIRAVVLDNPTPFCLSEMIRTSSSSTPDSSDDLGLLSSHLLFRGGGTDDGNNPNSSIVWFHNVPELNDEEIGEYNSGVYRGTSWRRAVEVMESHNNEQQRHPLFKFFFNYVEFRQQELEDLLEDGSDSHDGWVSLTIPSGMILDNSYDKNDCWTRLRNIMKQQQQQEQ
jgi:hypothetical protein